MRNPWNLTTFVAIAGLLAAGPAGAQPGAGAPYGQRDPATCAPLMQDDPPTVEQAIQLIRCEREVVTRSDELWLMEEMDLVMAPPVHWAMVAAEMSMPNSDPDKPVYPLTGSFTWLMCRTKAAAGDSNCTQTPRPSRTGACWQGTLKGWQCFLLS